MPRILLLSELHPALDELVAGAGLVGVLPDAGDAVGEPHIAEQARAHLRRAGAHVVDLDLDADVPEQLLRLDVLVATGGDPSALASRLRRTGAAPLVAAAVRGGLRYAGVSAGAMVAGPGLAPFVDVPRDELPPGDALRGLGLTPVHVLPHHGRRGRDALHQRALERHGLRHVLVPLADADALLLRDGSVELTGPQRGERLRSALPGDAAALAALAPGTAWPERLTRPGVLVATRDGEPTGVAALEAGGLTELRGGPEARLRAWAEAALR